MNPPVEKSGSQAALNDQRTGALAKYRAMVVGRPGFKALLVYELITMLCGSCPGALGLLLRKKLYPLLLGSCGRNVVFGRNVTLRHPHRICIGNGTVIGDDAVLDAKGIDGEGLHLGSGVFIGKGTILATVGGTLVLEDGVNVGAYCRISTMGRTRLGRKALLAAYVYIVGADHRADDPELPVVDQPNFTRGGIDIGEGSWLGTKVTVSDGSKVGHNCIVGAHALVNGEIPDYAVAVGIPARVIRDRRNPS